MLTILAGTMGTKMRAARNAGDVVSAEELNLGCLITMLDSISSVGRKCAMAVVNQTKSTWTSKGVYFNSGNSDAVLPETVKNNEALLFAGKKKTGPFATGTSGVFTYQLPDDKTLAVHWNVPFNFVLYENVWNVRVYPYDKSAKWKKCEQHCYL